MLLFLYICTISARVGSVAPGNALAFFDMPGLDLGPKLPAAMAVTARAGKIRSGLLQSDPLQLALEVLLAVAAGEALTTRDDRLAGTERVEPEHKRKKRGRSPFLHASSIAAADSLRVSRSHGPLRALDSANRSRPRNVRLGRQSQRDNVANRARDS